MVKLYKRNVPVKLSEHYSSKDFACECGCGETPVDDRLVEILEKIAAHFGVVPIVTSGYRCPKENARTPHANPKSYHVKGMAADIVVPGIHPRAVAKYAESIEVNGIGLYLSASGGYFTHLDSRPREKRQYWKGHEGILVPTFGGREIKFSLNVRVLQYGMQGDDVKALQYALAGRGLYESGFDGHFGPGTKRAVMAFQKSEGLDVDGSCGPATRRKLLGVE